LNNGKQVSFKLFISHVNLFLFCLFSCSVALEDQLLLSRLVSLLVLDVGKLGPDTAWGLLFGQLLLIIEYVGVLYVLLCV